MAGRTRRVFKVLLWTAATMLMLVAAGLFATQTSWFREWARGMAERQSAALLNGQLRIGRLEGNLWTGAVMTDVRIIQDGREVVRIDRVRVAYDVRRLVKRQWFFPDVTLTRPSVVLIHTAEGWRIAGLFRARRTVDPNAAPVQLPSLTIEDGRVAIEDAAADRLRWPGQIRALDADLGLVLGGGRTDLTIRRAAMEAENPGLSVSALSGHWVAEGGRHQVQDLHLRTARGALDGDVAYEPGRDGRAASLTARAEAAPLDLDEFAGLVPALAGRGLVLTGSVRATGSMDDLSIQTRLTDPRAGHVAADVVLSTAGDRRAIRGNVVTTNVDLARPLLDPPLASRLTSKSTIDLVFRGGWSFAALSGSATVESTASTIWGYRWDALRGRVRFGRGTLTIDGTIAAYGARGTAEGTIVPVGGPVRYALRGHLSGVDLRRLPPQLPIPALESTIAGEYVVEGAGSRLEASATFDPSVVEGIRVGDASTGRFSNRDGVSRYGFAGHVADADIQRLGRALDLPAISGDDYASQVTGMLTVDGSGTALDTLQIDVQAALEPSQIFTAELGPGQATARIADRQLAASFAGRVAGVDAGRLTGRTDLAGELTGTIDVQGTVANLGEPFRLEALTGRGSITLEPSAIGPLALERASVEASLANGQAEVAMFEAVGPRLNATASGRVALGDAGESDLTYTVSMTQLADLGPLVGRGLDGRVLVEGTVTGNRTNLAAAGTAAFSGLAVADAFDALTLHTTFDAHLPDLDVDHLTASFKAESTLFTVAGRTIPKLDAAVDVTADRYRFEVTANETGRTITAAGDLTTIDDAREVTVNRLSLVTGPATWTLADAGPVQVRYDPSGLVSLPQEITLVNNGQQLSAQGSLALTDTATGSLDVTVSGVDLTELGALLLSNRQLAGTLMGDARITGSRTSRTIVGNIKILAGIVDGYAFQSFDTLLAYRGEQADIDAILIQSPGSALVATGTVPFAIDRGVLTDRPLTFDVTSEGIDLAVLEAANTGLVDARGQLVVDLHITGTGTDPVGRGSIKVVNGAFTVRPTGVRYTDAAIDATVEGTDVQVTQLRLRDQDNDALEGSGRLRLENREVRDIDFKAQATNLDVLNNEFGRLSVDAALTLAGTLGAPRIAGNVRLDSGRLEVDQILDRFGSAPYEPLDDPARGPAAGPQKPAEPMVPLALNLTVDVPNNLVLRGRDMRAGSGGVSLGDVNLTAGGRFTLVREGTGGPVLVGTISTVRGSYDFQGRRFEVLRDGQIILRGEQPIDPALNVNAERVISGIVARVNVGGSMRAPEVTLSSQPPLDQTDILSLIVFNQPANQLTQGQSVNLGERAAQVAGGFVAAPLSDTLGRALNVDILTLDPSGDAGQGPSVTVGQQVGERLFLKFRQIFGTRDVSEFQLEYQLADFLRLQGSIADGQTSANRSLTRRVERSGIDLVVYFSY